MVSDAVMSVSLRVEEVDGGVDQLSRGDVDCRHLQFGVSECHPGLDDPQGPVTLPTSRRRGLDSRQVQTNTGTPASTVDIHCIEHHVGGLIAGALEHEPLQSTGLIHSK